MARLLATVCMEHNGELRVKAIDYDSLDKPILLIVDFDRATSEIVIRATTNSGRCTIVPPENHGWLRPPEDAPRERQQAEAQKSVQRRILRSDEEEAELEEKRNREATLAREVAEGSTSTRFRTVPPGQHPSGQ